MLSALKNLLLPATSKSTKAAPKPRLQVESLEGRELPSVTSIDIYNSSVYKTKQIEVYLNDSASNVSITQSNGKIYVKDSTNNFNQSKSATGIQAVVIFGGNGNDRVVNSVSTIQMRAYGYGGNDNFEGSGMNDILDGGDGNDILRGNGGNDTLKGGNNNDMLYGGTGDDTLEGGKGDDMLFGWTGNNNYNPGFGADRLLLSHSGEYGQLGLEDIDARIEFRKGTKSWTAAEIEHVDKALNVLQSTMGSTIFLETSKGNDLVFERNSGTKVGSNNGSRIQLTDLVMNGNTTWETGYILHEIGHNWDEESPIASDFKKISGWTTTNKSSDSSYVKVTKYNDTLWVKKNAEMASSYAKTHPHDDFAESFSAYFLKRAGMSWYSNDGTGATAIPKKIALIDKWVRSL